MAASQSDGSIVLSTKVDTSGMKKGMSSLQGMIGKVGAAISAAFAIKKVTDFVKASIDAFAEYEQLVGGVETLFKDSAGKVMKYANEAYKTAGLSANEYMASVTSFSASLLSSLGGDTEKAADIANEALISMSDNANKMGSSMESIQMAFQGFAKGQYMLLDNLKLGYGGTKTEMERLLKDAEAWNKEQGKIVEYSIDNLADVYTAIGDIQEKLGIAGTTAAEAATTISGAAAMMSASWKNVMTAISGGGDMDVAIENFVSAVEVYFDNILPVVEKALNGVGAMIERVAPKLAETVGKAFVASIPDLITAIYAMIVGAFKGIFAGVVALFRKETSAILEESAEKIEQAADNQEELTQAVKETNKELKKTLAGFDDLQILSSGAGEEIDPLQSITTSAEGAVLDGSPYVKEADATLTAIMAIIGVCLAAVGLILLFTGNVPSGVGFIIAGAATLGVAMGTASAFEYDGIIQMITTIMGIAGGALLALGIILLWIGDVVGKGVAIGMIIAGGALIVSAVAAQAAFAPEDIAAWLSIILGIAGGALLALGVILCMAGSVPVGVGMIVAGAVAIVSAVALNSDAVVEAIQGPLGAIMAIVGAALLVIGIILVCTGVGIPIGIALIVAGAAALVTPIALNWDAIVEWISGAWEAVKGFWNRYIAPIFTAKFWTDLAKTCGNGLIAGFEGAVNGIIWLFEGMINFVVDGLNLFIRGVDSVISAVGSIFGQDWGVATIPRANLGRISIPRLAQGAVIPPNREFLAVLGDQKSGTNIEAPLSTIEEAVENVLNRRGGADTVREEHYYLDETELMSIIYRLTKGGERLSGRSLAKGGAV